MNKFWTLLALGLSLSLGAAHAEQEGDAKTPQQNKMVNCNKQAGDKKGDERKAFMKGCLSGKPAAAATVGMKATPQEKMKSCNKDAGEKKLAGDARKAFMVECLSK